MPLHPVLCSGSGMRSIEWMICMHECWGRFAPPHHHRVFILALCAATVPLYFKIGGEFFPQTDESQFTLSYKAPIGTRVEQRRSEHAARKDHGRCALAKKGQPPIHIATLSDIGLPGGRTALYQQHRTLAATSKWLSSRAASAMKATPRSSIASAARCVTRPLELSRTFYRRNRQAHPEHRTAGAPSTSRFWDKIRTWVRSTPKSARQAAQSARPTRPTASTDLQITREENYPELHIEVDRMKAGVLGISEQQVAQSVPDHAIGQHPVSADSIQRSQNRQRILCQRARG